MERVILDQLSDLTRTFLKASHCSTWFHVRGNHAISTNLVTLTDDIAHNLFAVISSGIKICLFADGTKIWYRVRMQNISDCKIL